MKTYVFKVEIEEDRFDDGVNFPPLSRQKFGILKVDPFFPPCDVFVLFLPLATDSDPGIHNCQKVLAPSRTIARYF